MTERQKFFQSLAKKYKGMLLGEAINPFEIDIGKPGIMIVADEVSKSEWGKLDNWQWVYPYDGGILIVILTKMGYNLRFDHMIFITKAGIVEPYE